MQVTSLALLVVGAVVLALFVLVGFAIHRLADTSAKKIVGVVIAITVLLGVVPTLIAAFGAFTS